MQEFACISIATGLCLLPLVANLCLALVLFESGIAAGRKLVLPSSAEKAGEAGRPLRFRSLRVPPADRERERKFFPLGVLGRDIPPELWLRCRDDDLRLGKERPRVAGAEMM